MKLKHNFCFQALFILASVVFNVAYADSQLLKNQIQLAGQTVRSDHVIIRFKNSSQTTSFFSQQATFFSELGLKEKKTIKFSPVNSSATTTATNQKIAFSILVLNGKKDLKTVLKRLNEHPSIQYAEPDFVLHKKNLPNDEFFSELWGLDNQGQDGGVLDADIDAPEAWNTITDSTSIVVGVVDTGVDYTHEDLVANMWVNLGEIPSDGIDNDSNGYVDDIHGIDCANGDSDPMDLANHGTHVAGTIGAEGNNGIGITGVSWNAKIMALKVFGDSDSEADFVSSTIECLAYAVNMKQNYGVDIRITNNSYGNENSQAQKDAIQASANVGMLFITAAGNFSDDNDIVRDYLGDYDIDNCIVSPRCT
jgi:subtilisin family serine protease